MTFRLVPNVGLEDESPSSKSEGTPEEDRGCVGEVGGAVENQGSNESITPQPDITDIQRSPRHQTFTNGERRRRKLPEIPKNRKCESIIYYFDSSAFRFHIVCLCIDRI